MNGKYKMETVVGTPKKSTILPVVGMQIIIRITFQMAR
jgi:hypothetical protein